MSERLIIEYRLGECCWRLALATTWRQRTQGLARLPREIEDQIDGMLFVFPFAWRWAIWMRGMKYGIDAYWLRRGEVVDCDLDLMPDGGRRVYRPGVRVDGLVEIRV